MPQTLVAPAVGSAPSPSVTVLQGRDPATGHLTTWHLAPMDADERDSAPYRVEWVAGCITHPAVWMQATKESAVITRAEARALQLAVSAG